MSHSLKRAVTDNIRNTIIDNPLEPTMVAPSTCTWEVFPIKPIASTTHFMVALSRQDPVGLRLYPTSSPNVKTETLSARVLSWESLPTCINDFQVAVPKKPETEHAIYRMVSFQSQTPQSATGCIRCGRRCLKDSVVTNFGQGRCASTRMPVRPRKSSQMLNVKLVLNSFKNTVHCPTTRTRSSSGRRSSPLLPNHQLTDISNH